MRSRNFASFPWRRASSQLNRAVRAPPTCRYPVGLGAKRVTIAMGQRLGSDRQKAIRGGYVFRVVGAVVGTLIGAVAAFAAGSGYFTFTMNKSGVRSAGPISGSPYNRRSESPEGSSLMKS